MDPIWITHPESYAKVEAETRRELLFPKLLEIVNSKPPQTFLDYGCGDGSFVFLLDKQIEIALFDISSKALSIAHQRLHNRKYMTYTKESDIPSNYFDCILFSLVLMTIDAQDKIKASFSTLSRVKKRQGRVIVAVTHPCFRQYHFSTFHTEYANGRRFDYFDEGAKFRVFLRDRVSNESVSFNDYHWNLSSTLNLLIEAGLNLTEVIELPDHLKKDEQYQYNVAPYLVLVCQ